MTKQTTDTSFPSTEQGTPEAGDAEARLLRDEEQRPLFGKYGRIDNLARAITHGEYAVVKDLKQMYSQDYRSIVRAIESLVSAGIAEERARLKKLLRGLACTCGHHCPSRSEWQHGATCVHQDWCALAPDDTQATNSAAGGHNNDDTEPQASQRETD